MGTYKVKSKIKGGKKASQVFKPGSSIELTEQEAWNIRHALENPPKYDPNASKVAPEILESIRNNPLHPDSGVDIFWKREANVSKRTAGNKTAIERKLEPMRQKTVAVQKAESVKKAQVAAAAPVVPPVTRPAPANQKK